MDNVVDALFMGAAVLVFIIALSVSISSISDIKEQFEAIVTSDEVIDLASENGDYINYIKAVEDGYRIVGFDTVISTIRRIRGESYDICLVLQPTTTLDLGDKIDKYSFFKIPTESGKNIIKISLSSRGDQIGQVINDDIMEKIYKSLRGKSFNEYLGIYKKRTNSSVASVNKETYRIITFEEIL